MKDARFRFTTEEKSVILKEVCLAGLDRTSMKYGLTREVLIRWQKKFRGSKAGAAMPKIEAIKNVDLTELEHFEIDEDHLLRLVAKLVVQSLLSQDSINL